jgi:hypothetical protein
MLTRALPRTHPRTQRGITTRRVSAGIHGAPGATSRLPAWWSAEDWTGEVKATLRLHRDVCQIHHVEADTVLAVARGMAGYADHATGRDCRPTNERLVTDVRVSLSTVQRARRVLKSLGFVVELVAGRSFLTREERLAAWRRGSAHRQLAAEFALCGGRDRPRRPHRRRHPQLHRVAVERDTPPPSHEVRGESHLSRTHLRATTETKKAAPRPAPTKEATNRGGRRGHPLARRLAESVQRRLTWLRGVPLSRLVPLLTPFALAGWTGRDVERAADEARAMRGWKVVPAKLDHPASYLARLLRGVDLADRPGAVDEFIAAVEAAGRRHELQLRIGTPCAHGQPAGNVPHPVHGHLACPLCRAAAAAELPSWP